MAQQQDSHAQWLEDSEYRIAYGEETARLEAAAMLAKARSIVGLTQSALAQQAGVSQAYIGKLERGDANPTIGTLGRLLANMRMKIEIRPVPMGTPETDTIVAKLDGQEKRQFPFKVIGGPPAQ